MIGGRLWCCLVTSCGAIWGGNKLSGVGQIVVRRCPARRWVYLREGVIVGTNSVPIFEIDGTPFTKAERRVIQNLLPFADAVFFDTGK